MMPVLRSLALLVALVTPLFAQDGPEPTEADKSFFRDFKRAVLAGDRAWVIDHTCFPVRALVDGRTRVITSASELETAYASIMTLDTLTAIRRQTPETLVRTRHGVMVGDGNVWFAEDPAPAPNAPPRTCIIAFGNTD